MVQVVLDYCRNNPRGAALYMCLFAGCTIVYKTLQAPAWGAYDYMLTLSAALQSAAFGLLALETQSSAGEGLSEKSLWCFFISNVARLSTTFWGQGYVPEDSTSDMYLYQILELVGVLLLSFQLLKLTTVRAMHDVGQAWDRWSLIGGMSAVALVLAYNTHSTGHADYFADLLWMFAIWLEAFALIPQVLLLKDEKMKVDETAAHFVVLTLFSAAVFAAFWARHARDQYSHAQTNSAYACFFYGILIASAIRLCLCGAYLYLFVKASGGTGAGKRGEYEMCAQDMEADI